MRADQRVSPAQVHRQVGRVLDELAITDVVYHGLEHSRPLVEALILRLLNRVVPGGRVLVFGANSLLIQTVLDAGYDLHLWRFGENLLTDDLEERIEGRLTPEMLASGLLPFGTARYDAIVMPLVLEHVLASPAAVLGGLTPFLDRDGAIITASRNLASLAIRRRALFGQAYLPDWRESPVLFSMNWPDLPSYRFYTLSELTGYAREVGLLGADVELSMGERAFNNADFLRIKTYIARKATHWIRQGVPWLRDFIVLTLLPATRTELSGEGRPFTETPRVGGGATLPFVSVILPTHNRSAMLRDSLSGLARQTYPADRFEVVVVDDASGDDTGDVVRELSPELSFPVRYMKTTGVGAPAARNLGMREAIGVIVAHLDDDCRPCPEWMDEGVRAFSPGVAIVSGPVVPKPEQARPFFSIAPQYLAEQGVYPTANAFYLREAAIAAGGFDESFGGNIAGRPAAGWDADLAWRIRRRGATARFQQGAIVYNEVFPMRPKAWLVDGVRAVNLPLSVKRVPELGRFMLLGGLFLDRPSLYFDLAVAGTSLALLRRQFAPFSMALPWSWWVLRLLRHDLRSPVRWPKVAFKAAFIGLKQGVTLAALLVGSVRARRLVL